MFYMRDACMLQKMRQEYTFYYLVPVRRAMLVHLGNTLRKLQQETCFYLSNPF
jgi:hypothetical protein